MSGLAWLLLAGALLAEEPAQALPPLPPAQGVQAVSLPAIQVESLPGGATLWQVQQPGASLVALELLVTLPPESLGLEQRGGLALLPSMIDLGSRTAPPGGLGAQLEPLGASVLLAREPTGLRLRLLAPPERFEPALAVLAQALFEPALSRRPLRRKREVLSQALERSQRSTSGILRRTEALALYGASHPLAPLDPEDVQLGRRQLRALHRQLLERGGAQLVLVGPPGELDPSSAVARHLGALGARSWDPRLPAVSRQSCALAFIDDPGSRRVALQISWPLPPELGVAEAQLVADVLGGGATARLERRLREELGLVYEARASLLREPGQARLRVALRVAQPQAHELLLALQAELAGLARIEPSELQRARATRLFALARALDGAEPSAALLREQAWLGLVPGAFQAELDALAGLDLPAVQAAARELLDPAHASWAVMGDGETLADIACLAGLHPGCGPADSAEPPFTFCPED
jgi:zinc protease